MKNYPLVYELNTRCWLRDLGDLAGKPVKLGQVPAREIERIASLGFTHVWLMGVWETGPRSRAIAREDKALDRSCRIALPDLEEEDFSGSPFAVAAYRVDRELGGETGLKTFRTLLKKKGLKLILDFVPNHVGLDHAWLETHPERFVHKLEPAPETFRIDTAAGPMWVAHGKDPNFAAWLDTVQIDYRRPDARAAVIEDLKTIASLCDGVRCDMAMLLLNDVFLQTWQGFPCIEPPPATEFWARAIQELRVVRKDFLFLAEAYWDLEGQLQELGFDYAYDKRLYDYLVARDYPAVQSHLTMAAPEFLDRSCHFLENHDEQRIASVLAPGEHRAAALLLLVAPGMRLIYEGQMEGACLQNRVHLSRRPEEPVHPEIRDLYERLLAGLAGTAVGRGSWRVLTPRSAWNDNGSFRNLVVIAWQAKAPEFDLAVVNLAPHTCQAYVPLGTEDLSQTNWSLVDLLGEERYERNGDDLAEQGLYLDVGPHAAQVFHFKPI